MFLAACPHTLGFTVSDVSSYNMHFLSECQLDLWPPCSPGWHFCRFCKCMTSGNPINLYVWPLSVWGCPSWAVSEVPPIPNVYDVFKLMNLRREPCISVFTTPTNAYTQCLKTESFSIYFSGTLCYFEPWAYFKRRWLSILTVSVFYYHILLLLSLFFFFNYY